MNIAFVTSTKRWGGVKTWILEFSLELKKLGHNILIFAKDEKFINKAEENGLNALRINFGFDYNPKTVVKFIRYFKEYNIDIVCLNVQKELRSAGIAARILGVPVVHRVGLASDIVDKFDFKIINKYVTDKILVPCKTMKKELTYKHKFIDEAGISVVYNGKTPIVSNPSTSVHDPVKFVITSKVEKSKGHDYLANVLLTLKNKGLSFHLDIFGEGNLSGWFEDFIKKNQLDGYVRFKGFEPDIKHFLPEYDFGLLTSYSEGFPNVLLEYMSAGLPVISSNVSGVAEIVEENFNGFLFKAGDENKLEILFEKAILIDIRKYEGMSSNALDTMSKRFNLKTNAFSLVNFFENVIKTKNTQLGNRN